MVLQVRQSRLDRVHVGYGHPATGRAAVHAQGPHRGHQHRHVGNEAAVAVDDVKELFGPQVRREPALRDDVVGGFQGQLRGQDRIVAVGDVGKGTAVDERRLALQRLNQVRLQSLGQHGRHRAGRPRSLANTGRPEEV